MKKIHPFSIVFKLGLLLLLVYLTHSMPEVSKNDKILSLKHASTDVRKSQTRVVS